MRWGDAGSTRRAIRGEICPHRWSGARSGRRISGQAASPHQVALMRLGEAPDKSLLDPIETASRDEIAALQTRRLSVTLRRVYDAVPAMRAKFDQHGVHPDDFRALEDLKRFPFTAKSDLRANYPFGLLAVPKDQLARVHASSGTTGKPTVVGYTRNDLSMWSDMVARTIRAAGGRKGMMAHNAYGYGLFTGGLGYHYGAERLGCALVPISGGMTERQIQLINDFAPDILFSTPSYALCLVDEFRAQGLDPRRSSLKLGVFRRGALDQRDAQRTRRGVRHGRARQLWPVRSDRAWRRRRMRGDQGWAPHLGGSFLSRDRRSRRPAPSCPTARSARSCLPRSPRKRCRSSATGPAISPGFLPGTARSMRRMEKISGRTDDMMIVRGVNVFPTQIEELILGVPSLSAALSAHSDPRRPAGRSGGSGRGSIAGRSRRGARACRQRTRTRDEGAHRHQRESERAQAG